MIGAAKLNDAPVSPPPQAVSKLVLPPSPPSSPLPPPKKAMGVFGLLLLAGVAYAATR